jgi:peptide/nickel transport system ATP-binding protein
MSDTGLLVVDGLAVSFKGARGATDVLRDVDFCLAPGERLGVVGESGAGKSTIGRTILGLLPDTATVSARRFDFAGEDLVSMPPRQRHGLRGRRMAMILQDPKHALNPVMTVGAQISEVLRAHAGLDAASCRARGIELLASVRIKDPERVWRAHAHTLSGGLAQRAMIAMMLAPGPDLLVADEATSALDVMARESVLAVLDEQQRARDMAVIMISHDLGLVTRFCDRVLVLRDGVVVETAPADDLRRGEAEDPYTRHLLALARAVDIEQGAS